MILQLTLSFLAIAIGAVCCAPSIRKADSAFVEHLSALRCQDIRRINEANNAHRAAQWIATRNVAIASLAMVVALVIIHALLP